MKTIKNTITGEMYQCGINIMPGGCYLAKPINGGEEIKIHSSRLASVPNVIAPLYVFID